MKPEMFMMNKLFPLPKQGKIWHTLMQCDARKSVLEFGLRLNARIFCGMFHGATVQKSKWNKNISM